MKIGIDARRMGSTTGRYVSALLKYLPELDEDNQYHIIINPEDQGLWAPETENFYLHVVPYTFNSIGEQFGYRRFLYKLNLDLMHFYLPQQPLFYWRPKITTIHDLILVKFGNPNKNPIIYFVKQTVFKFFIKSVARRSEYVITPSNYSKHDIISYTNIPPHKVIVTYEAAEPVISSHPKEVKAMAGKKFLMNVGNGFPHKNIGFLIDVFADLVKSRPELHLAIIGKINIHHQKLEQYVADKSIPNIDFLGYVSDAQLAWLYSRAEAYVFPSLYEGFGLPGLEAMVHNLPLVSSNASCLPEVYGDGAEYFDPRNAASALEAITTVLDSHRRRQQLVKAAQERLDRYSWQKMAQKTHRIYQRALGLSRD